MPELVSILGVDNARILAKYQGGVDFYVPKAAAATHSLAKIIGCNGMKALCVAYRGEYITVPNGADEPYKLKIIALLEAGKTKQAIAQEVGCTERYVYNVAAETGYSSRQLTLPLF